LRRYIQHEVETRIARALLAGTIADGATVTLDAGPDGLEVSVEEPKRADEPEAERVGVAA
jgi:ATP-dependent Clp protease ATP-binding subunit ClpB